MGSGTKVLNLYWVPLHAATMPGLTATASRVGSKEKVITSTDSAEQAEQWKYYATALELRTAGTWRIEVTAGEDKGCFELTLEG